MRNSSNGNAASNFRRSTKNFKVAYEGHHCCKPCDQSRSVAFLMPDFLLSNPVAASGIDEKIFEDVTNCVVIGHNFGALNDTATTMCLFV